MPHKDPWGCTHPWPPWTEEVEDRYTFQEAWEHQYLDEGTLQPVKGGWEQEDQAASGNLETHGDEGELEEEQP